MCHNAGWHRLARQRHKKGKEESKGTSRDMREKKKQELTVTHRPKIECFHLVTFPLQYTLNHGRAGCDVIVTGSECLRPLCCLDTNMSLRETAYTYRHAPSCASWTNVAFPHNKLYGRQHMQ